MSTLYASDLSAQKVKSVKETVLEIELSDVTLNEVLSKIEVMTDYEFSFNKKDLDNQVRISKNFTNSTVADILLEVSKQSNLKFKQIGKTIHISKIENAYQEKIEVVADIDISGQIVDETGQGLPGASVVIQGTTTGTTTDIEGRYKLTVPENAVLVVSFIGYMQQVINVGSRNVINVTMSLDSEQLDEVVVVGYGTQTKETLTGSIASINGEELERNPNANIVAGLQGRLPGLTSSNRSGEPGDENMDILIRGTGTFGDNSPLIIIDGVQRDQLGRLNPQDIESITVLKDASAAIYGARAANGVILVTTKGGQVGKPKFSFNYNTAFTQPTKRPDMLESWEFAEVINERDWYELGRPANYTPYFSDEAIQKFKDGSDPILYPNTDWPEEIMKTWALQQRASLQVTGGTEDVRYLLSFAALTQDGNYKFNSKRYDQYNMRAKIDVDITENLTVGLNVNSIINKNQGNGNNYWGIIRADPTSVARYPNGLIAPGRLGGNPMLAEQSGYNRTEEFPIYSTFTATYQVPFVKGLQIDASYNYDHKTNNSKNWSLPTYFYEYNTSTGEYDKGTNSNGRASLSETYRKWTTRLVNYRISYEKDFGPHHLKAMVGQEQQENKYSYISANRRNYVSQAIDQIDVGSNAEGDFGNGGSASATAYNNYFGRINYDFQSKYLAEFLFRRDGSQVFPEGNRYGFFPGFSLGWRLSEEDIIQNALPAFNQLKLRLSHGSIGNDRVGQWQYLQAFAFGNNYVFGTNDQPGVVAQTLPNPNITWEVSKKTDIGLDGSLWDNSFGFEFTLWKENRSNILAARNLSVPAILGFPALPDENIGEVDNKGFELILRHQNRGSKFTYNIEGNMAFARSEIIYMDETPNTEAYQNREGKPVGADLYYQADGIFNTQEEFDSYPHLASAQVGDIKFVDLNGDGEITVDDRFRFDKSATPEIVFGLNFGAVYGDLDFSIFFQGQTGAYNYDDKFPDLGTVTGSIDNAFRERYENHWTVDNPNGTMPRASGDFVERNTFFLQDATFIRLKNLEVGYTLPEGLLSKIGLDETRIYVNGFNLLTWSKEIKHVDPELSGNALFYPQLRVINLGANISF